MNFIQEKIYLLGFMGSGKSTIGRTLAKRLNMKFIDLDEIISIEHGKSIAAIFESEGEPFFRDEETKFLKETFEINSLLVSLGGGTPCFNGNMDLIKVKGRSVYIEMTPEDLVSRLWKEKDSRPLVRAASTKSDLHEKVSNILKLRNDFYNQASIIVNGNQKVDDVVSEIIDQLNL